LGKKRRNLELNLHRKLTPVAFQRQKETGGGKQKAGKTQ